MYVRGLGSGWKKMFKSFISFAGERGGQRAVGVRAAAAAEADGQHPSQQHQRRQDPVVQNQGSGRRRSSRQQS